VRGKAVEDHALRRVGRVEPVADHADHDVVGNQPAGLHHRIGLLADLGARGDRRAQHVAGGELHQPARLGENARLGAFSGPGGPSRMMFMVVPP
jgi:hypothetical protein